MVAKIKDILKSNPIGTFQKINKPKKEEPKKEKKEENKKKPVPKKEKKKDGKSSSWIDHCSQH